MADSWYPVGSYFWLIIRSFKNNFQICLNNIVRIQIRNKSFRIHNTDDSRGEDGLLAGFLVRGSPEPVHPLVHVVYEPGPGSNVLHSRLKVEAARLHEQGHLLGSPVKHIPSQETWKTEQYIYTIQGARGIDTRFWKSALLGLHSH